MQAAGELPDGTRSERVLRLEPQQELLEVVESAERRHRPRECACGRPVDPADARPERRLRESPEEAELEQDPVDAAAREDEGDVASVGVGHEAIVPPWSRSFGRAPPFSPDLDLESDEELWEGDDDGDHGGWFCVRTDPFPCPARGARSSRTS